MFSTLNVRYLSNSFHFSANLLCISIICRSKVSVKKAHSDIVHLVIYLFYDFLFFILLSHVIKQINYQVHKMSLQLKTMLPSEQSRLHCILVRQVSLFLSPLTEQNESQTHYQVTNKNKYKKGENKQVKNKQHACGI